LERSCSISNFILISSHACWAGGTTPRTEHSRTCITYRLRFLPVVKALPRAVADSGQYRVVTSEQIGTEICSVTPPSPFC
jgi:hypothetical protein